MQSSGPFAVIIFIGCSSSVTWALPTTDPPATDATTPDSNLSPYVKWKEEEEHSFTQGDEKVLELDKQRWNRGYERHPREARKRPYVPFNSLTFMTANNAIPPLDWNASNSSDIRQQIAGSKLAGFKKPANVTATPSLSTRTPFSTTKLFTTTKPPRTTTTVPVTYTPRIPVTENPIILSYLSTLHKLHSASPYDLPVETSTFNITESSTSEDQSSIWLPSKIITFIPDQFTTSKPTSSVFLIPNSSSKPDNKTSDSFSTWWPEYESSQTPPTIQSTTTRPSLMPVRNRVRIGSTTQPDRTTTKPSSTVRPGRPSVSTSTNLPNRFSTATSQAKSTTVTPTRSPTYNTQSATKTRPTPPTSFSSNYFPTKSSLQPVYSPSRFTPPPNQHVTSSQAFNSPATWESDLGFLKTSVPDIDTLVINEALSKITKQSTRPLTSTTESIFTDVTTKPIVFIEEPSTIGLSNHSHTNTDDPDTMVLHFKDDNDRIIESEPITNWVTNPKPSGRPHLLPVQAPTREKDVTTFISNTKRSTTTVPPNKEDTSVSEYEYEFYEDNLNAGGIQDYTNPESLDHGNNKEHKEPEDQPVVLVKVWEMRNGQLNLLKQHPVPMQLFQNSSLSNGAVVNPQEVPPQVLKMIADNFKGPPHPLLDPALYHHNRIRRSNANVRAKRDPTMGDQHREGKSTNTNPGPLLKPLRSKTQATPLFTLHDTKTLNSQLNADLNGTDDEHVIHFIESADQSNPDEFHPLDSHSKQGPSQPASPAQVMADLENPIKSNEMHRISRLKDKSFNDFIQETNPSTVGGILNDYRYIQQRSPQFHSRVGSTPDHGTVQQQRQQQQILSNNKHFGGVGNPSYANLPLAIGTALAEQDGNYLQVLTQFANQLANSRSIDPSVQAYMQNVFNLSNKQQGREGYHFENIDTLTKSRENDPSAFSINQPQSDSSHKGSVLELLPHDLPHVNPLLPPNGEAPKDPVNLGDILTSLPSSSTINREKLQNTLSTLTGTNTFSGHLGNQGYLNQNNHASQNSMSGNYGEQPAFNEITNSQSAKPDNFAFINDPKAQQPSSPTTQETLPYYPFAHQGQSNPPSFQQQNTRPSMLASLEEPQIQEDAPFSILDQLRPPRPTIMDSLYFPQNFGNDFNEAAPPYFSPPVQQPYRISNYPSPLLDFILNNATRPGFQPIEDESFAMQPPASTPSFSGTGFNPFDAYIPATGGPLLSDSISPVSASGFVTPVQATFTSGSSISSIRNCVGNTLCGLGLAGLLSAGISKALLLPFLLGRRRRDLSSRKTNGRRHSFFPRDNMFLNSNNVTENSSEAATMNFYNADNKYSNLTKHEGDTKSSTLNSVDMVDHINRLLDIFNSLPQDQQILLMSHTLQVLTQGDVTRKI